MQSEHDTSYGPNPAGGPSLETVERVGLQVLEDWEEDTELLVGAIASNGSLADAINELVFHVRGRLSRPCINGDYTYVLESGHEPEEVLRRIAIRLCSAMDDAVDAEVERRFI